MSNTTIQIRRSTLNAEPSILNIAEPAYSYTSNSLFIGTPDSNGFIKIGGYSEIVKLDAAYNSVNAAFDAANAAGGASAAASFDKANNAYANAIFANTVAIAAFGAANNVVSGGPAYDSANAAFNRANIANLVPVGNTMANGYFSVRSSKNKINFIPGTNITINVDDDPTLNTSNITIGTSVLTTNTQHVAIYTNTEGSLGEAPGLYTSGNNLFNTGNITCGLEILLSEFVYPGNGTLFLKQTDPSKISYSLSSNGNFLNINRANGDIVFRENNSPQMTLKSNTGRLGIGTSSPSTPLHVNGTGVQEIRIQSTDNATQLTLLSGAGVPFTQVTGVNGPLYLNTQSANSDMIFRVGSLAERMRILGTTGNVGIGISTPTRKLDIFGSDVLATMGDPSGATAYLDFSNRVKFGFNGSSAVVNGLTKSVALLTSAGVGLALTPTNGNVGIGGTISNTDTLSGAKMVVLGSGNVGIGTNSPIHNLDVNAGINANSYIIISGLNVAPAITYAYTYAANNVMLAANSAYDKANAANIIAVTSFEYANGVNTNTFTSLATSVAAFTRANLAYTFAANNAFGVGNAAFTSGNTTYTYAANVVMSAANAAFSQANGANIVPVGNTMSNGYFSVRSSKRRINFISGTNITINVDDDATLNTANITIAASVSGGDPSYAFDRANIANLQPVGNTMSNGYFSVRSTKNKINFIPGTNITINVDDDPTLNTVNVTIIASAGADPAAPLAFNKANLANITADSAFGYANGVNTNTFTALATSIAAFGYANGVNTNTFTALTTAIAAYAAGNTTWTYAANQVMSAANAAFSQANGANIVPVGNTMSNGYYTVRSSKRQVNFIPGSSWDTVNVDTDATLNVSNITITTNLTGAFTQANLAWDKANLAYTFASNNAHLTANSAYNKANAANIIAESAFGYANGVNTNTFSSLAIAIASYGQANTDWTYASNNVMLVANSAYNKANAANILAFNALPNTSGAVFEGNLFTKGNLTVGGIYSTAYTLEVAGSFAAQTKSFIINHPSKTGMRLQYASLEGPENGVYIRGTIKGESEIELPYYWQDLVDVDSITVHLTPFSHKQDIWVDDIYQTFIKLNTNAWCYYIIYAERKDVPKLEVEIR